MGLLIGFALFVALGVLVPLFGADTRDGRDWRDYGRSEANQPGSASAPVIKGGTSDGVYAGWRS